jgi:hypothetical protein
VADQVPAPDLDEAPGWRVIDPDGNVVDSGPISHAQATAWVSELAAEAARNEGEQ